MTKFPSDKDLKKMREKLSKGSASKPLKKNAPLIEKVKHEICEKFISYKNEHNVTQKQMAETIGIDEALVSKILHYHYDEFTIDRLMTYLEILYQSVKFKIEVA